MRRLAPLLALALVAGALSRPARAEGVRVLDAHRVLGTIALGSFASALAIGAASGNLGKLTDPARCCPDGGDRLQPWRTVDRALVTAGIVAYSSAAALALYNLVVRNPPSAENPRVSHRAHRLLAIAHGTAFAVSAGSGLVMSRAQGRDPERFAAAAKVHVTANVLLVPLLTAALANILFE